MTNEAGDVNDAATHQPTLPDLELPEYHGQKPAGMRTSVSGTGNRLTRPHGIHDRAVLVLEVKCNESGHKDIDDALYYVEKHKVVDMFELDRDAGSRLLRHLRQTYGVAAAEARGQSQLESPDGLVLHADETGVVLTDREIAERRGDVLAVIGAEDLTPVVVMYSDGSRFLWPDEFPPDTIRPAIGQTAGDSGALLGSDERQPRVVELIHHATGETIESTLVEETDKAVEYFGGAADAPKSYPSERREMEAPPIVDPGWEGKPGDHRPVADDGGYGDVEDYDAPTTQPAKAPPLPGEEELALILPRVSDFDFVNRAVPVLREKLREVEDVEHARRLLEAEKQGRGQGHRARRGALDAIRFRLAELGWSES